MKWLDKDPDEIDYRDIDWTLRLYNEAERIQYEAAVALNPALELTPLLAVIPADTLQSSTFTLPAPLTAGPASTFTQQATRVWFSASGVAGETYDVLNT